MLKIKKILIGLLTALLWSVFIVVCAVIFLLLFTAVPVWLMDLSYGATP